MANSIALAKNYTNLLDEVYKAASVTNDLTSDASLVEYALLSGLDGTAEGYKSTMRLWFRAHGSDDANTAGPVGASRTSRTVRKIVKT
ncbi:MAG: hypothetical protein LUG64_01470 [Clostridiales bacterium]|nr:hypothetical protein [Clostridiales bacterium]